MQYSAWCSDVDGLRRDSRRVSGYAREQLLLLSDRIDGHWRRLLDLEAKVGPSNLPRQIVHGDVSPVNILFNAVDEPAFIDWDCVHRGLRLYDALGDVLNRPPDNRPDWNCFNEDHVDEYLDGYASGLALPLTKLERQLVPTFCLARQLEDLRQRLYGLSKLDASQDMCYAKLIAMRVEMMDQIPLD